MQNKKQKTEDERCEKNIKKYKKPSYEETYEMFQSLRQDGFFCDIKLKADDGKIIIAHKVVLAAASQYFYEMFTTISESNHVVSDLVVMKEIDSTALELLVNFIYSGVIEVTEENVQDLLSAANILQLQGAKDACCDLLESKLCPTNCIGIYNTADLHSCTKLSTISELYIQQHFSEVIVDDFLSLSSTQVGGDDQSCQALDTVELYDPSLDTWTPVAKMCVRRKFFDVGVLDGVLYAVGGYNGSNNLSSVEAYRPSTGVWTTIADMHRPRRTHGAVVALDGLLYVIGRNNVGSFEDSTEYYSPETNTWTIVRASNNFAPNSANVVAINRPRHFKTN